MSFCLPKEQVDKFVQALKDGVINPAKLADMTSAERRAFFTKIVGEADAAEVNTLFESKLLLKNQQKGMISWAKKVAGITPEARRDMISRIERMTNVLDAESEKTFLEDLAAKKLGTAVTFEEAKQIADFSKKIVELKAEYDPKTSKWSDSPDWQTSAKRLEYGATEVAMQDYISELKRSNNKTTFRSVVNEFRNAPVATAVKYTIGSVLRVAGISKAINATFDNSLWGRQGFKAIITNQGIWRDNFFKSWKDIATTLGRTASNDELMKGIRAEIYSRPNAMNGLYRNARLDIGNTFEEAYPTSLPEKIPLLGRAYKASEVAYTGGAFRLRADIFDAQAKIAEGLGIDLSDKAEARSYGKLVNSLTGRGSYGEFDRFSGPVNVVLFSPKSLKASFDFLTAHAGQDMSVSAKKVARMNLVKVATAVAVTLVVAKLLNPDSVELDPRSSDFGKIKLGNTRIDVTGGMASLITLASRVFPSMNDGELGFYAKKNGKVSAINSGKYGAPTVGSVAWDFFSNKLAPVASVANDVWWRGQTYDRKKPTVKSEAGALFVPLPAKNIDELLHTPGATNIWLGSILDGLGFVTNTYESKK